MKEKKINQQIILYATLNSFHLFLLFYIKIKQFKRRKRMTKDVC